MKYLAGNHSRVTVVSRARLFGSGRVRVCADFGPKVNKNFWLN